MSKRLHFEELQVGQKWRSESRTVTESDVINFASTTGDFNPLHVSYEFASQTHYRKPIAHGLLGMAWVAGLGSNSPCVDTIALLSVNNWEFTKPIFFGETVYLVSEVVGKQANGRRTGRITWLHQLFNQNDELVQQGNFETLVRMSMPVKRPHLGDSPSKKPVELPENSQ